jgi:hypothetical protein
MQVGLVDRLRLIVFPEIPGAAGRSRSMTAMVGLDLNLLKRGFLTPGLPSSNSGLGSFEVGGCVFQCSCACVTSW